MAEDLANQLFITLKQKNGIRTDNRVCLRQVLSQLEVLHYLGNYSLKNRELHILYVSSSNDTVNDTVKAKNDTVNDTVFNLIKQNNRITSSEISEKLNISISTAKRKIKELKEEGIISRIGSDKSGYWEILTINKFEN